MDRERSHAAARRRSRWRSDRATRSEVTEDRSLATRISAVVTRSVGGRPARSSHSIVAKLYWSLAADGGSRRNCSAAAYIADPAAGGASAPATGDGFAWAMPKSARNAAPHSSKRTFAGFTSRCTIRPRAQRRGAADLAHEPVGALERPRPVGPLPSAAATPEEAKDEVGAPGLPPEVVERYDVRMSRLAMSCASASNRRTKSGSSASSGADHLDRDLLAERQVGWPGTRCRRRPRR